MRKRKFLRKYNPVSVPQGTPTGLPAGYKQLIMRAPVVDKQQTPMGNQDSPAPKPSQPSDHSPTIQGYDLPLPPAIVEKYTPPPVQSSTAWPVNHSSSHVTPAPSLTPETVQPDTPLVAPACGPDQSVLRRSERPGRGQTTRYQDFVSHLEESQDSPVFYTTPALRGELPAGMYKTDYPYDLVQFQEPGQPALTPRYYPALIGGSGILNITAHD